MNKTSEAQKKEKESWCVLCCVVFVCMFVCCKYFRRENLKTGCYWLLEIGISCTWELEYASRVIYNWAA